MSSSSYIQLVDATSISPTALVDMPRTSPRDNNAVTQKKKPSRRASHAVATTRQQTSLVDTREHPARNRSHAHQSKATQTHHSNTHEASRTQENIFQRLAAAFAASPARKRAAVIAFVIIIAGLTLYAPVRDLYKATRDRQIMQARYDALSATNSELLSELDRLRSVEGIQDEARKRGYVLPGETSVVVENVDTTPTEDASAASDSPWYQDVLDKLFGYEPQEW